MYYLVVYNNSQKSFDPSAIHNTVINIAGVIDWWHYLPNVYLISSSNNEKFIADRIINSHPGLLFLVIQVNLNSHNGVLPKNAWEWITNKTKAILKVKPAPMPTNLLPDITSAYLPSKPKPTGDPLLDYLLGIKK